MISGTNAKATSEMRRSIVNMIAVYTVIRKTVVRNSSIWSAMNARTFSTSDVQRWMMSPVGFLTCQL